MIAVIKIEAIVDAVRPIIAGHDSTVQSAALADLLSMWLAGHFVEGDRKATDRLRRRLLRAHIALVRELLPANERQILARMRTGSH
jgi:hemerythrin